MFDLLFQDFLSLFQENPLGQAFGYLGMFIILFGFFQTDDKKARTIIALSMIAWIIHFYLMGLTTALFASLLGVVRMLVSMKYQKNIYAFLSFVIIAAGFGIYTYENVLHLLPIITSITGAFTFFFLEKVLFRVGNLVNSLSWLFFHIQVGSLGGMTNEILTQFILIVTIFRMLSHDGHIHHYREVIHDILHKHQDVDMGSMVIVKDTHKIIKKEGYMHKLFHVFKKNT